MAIADRASDFWNRISPRERKLVVLLAIATPLVVALWLGLAIHDGLVAMETRNNEARKALDIVADLRAKGASTPTDDTVAQLKTEPVPLNTYLTKAAQTAGFTLSGTSPRPAITKNHFVTNSVNLRVSDLTIEQFQKFLKEIEARKDVVVTMLDIRKNFKAKDKLDATLDVSTYSKEVTEEDKAKEKEKEKLEKGKSDDKAKDKDDAKDTKDKKV